MIVNNIKKTYSIKNGENDKMTSVYVNKHLYKQFKIKSIETGITLKEILSSALHYYVSSSISGSC